MCVSILTTDKTVLREEMDWEVSDDSIDTRDDSGDGTRRMIVCRWTEKSIVSSLMGV